MAVTPGSNAERDLEIVLVSLPVQGVVFLVVDVDVIAVRVSGRMARARERPRGAFARAEGAAELGHGARARHDRPRLRCPRRLGGGFVGGAAGWPGFQGRR